MTGLPWRCLAAAGLLLTALRGVADAQFQQQYRPDAQRVQVSPFYGYRFGGDMFESAAGTPIDIDGAPSFGMSADFWLGLQMDYDLDVEEDRLASRLDKEVKVYRSA